jgi:hypothetical protein
MARVRQSRTGGQKSCDDTHAQQPACNAKQAQNAQRYRRCAHKGLKLPSLQTIVALRSSIKILLRETAKPWLLKLGTHSTSAWPVACRMSLLRPHHLMPIDKPIDLSLSPQPYLRTILHPCHRGERCVDWQRGWDSPPPILVCAPSRAETVGSHSHQRTVCRDILEERVGFEPPFLFARLRAQKPWVRIPTNAQFVGIFWRRGWDSNPRWTFAAR